VFLLLFHVKRDDDNGVDNKLTDKFDVIVVGGDMPDAKQLLQRLVRVQKPHSLPTILLQLEQCLVILQLVASEKDIL